MFSSNSRQDLVQISLVSEIVRMSEVARATITLVCAAQPIIKYHFPSIWWLPPLPPLLPPASVVLSYQHLLSLTGAILQIRGEQDTFLLQIEKSFL